MDIVYLNGAYIPKQDATVSIMDRGFLFGDSIYELIPVHKGKFIGGKLHFERMLNSLNSVFIDTPIKHYDDLKEINRELCQRNQLENRNYAIYIQISRGAEKFRYHRIPQGLTPTTIIFCLDVQTKDFTELEQGYKAITHNDLRHDTNFIKSNALQTNVMLYEKGRAEGALETILLRNDKVMECTSSNIFIVKDGIIKTPHLAKTILSGVTRALILQLANENNLAAVECDISKDELHAADEIWVCASNKEICPIVELDDHQIGNGRPGPLWHKMYKLYQHFKDICE